MRVNEKLDFDTLSDLVNKSPLASVKMLFSDIFKLISNPDATARQLKCIIERDPVLTMKILTLANSVYYGSFKKISDILQAIVWLGFDTVVHLVFLTKLYGIFNENPKEIEHFRISLWKSSIASAIMGKVIFRREFSESGNLIYTAGLLHNIGALFISLAKSDHFFFIRDEMIRQKRDADSLELNHYGVDHANLTSLIMKSWGFPDPLINIIKYHHNPVKSPLSCRKETLCLFLCDQIIHKKKLGFSDLYAYNDNKTQAVINFLGLHETMLLAVMYNVREELEMMDKMGWFGHES